MSGRDKNSSLLTLEPSIFMNGIEKLRVFYKPVSIDSGCKALMTGVLANRKWMAEVSNNCNFKRQIKKT